VTPSPGHRKCTPYLWPGLGGTPLALPLTEGLGSTGPRQTGAGLEDGTFDLVPDSGVSCATQKNLADRVLEQLPSRKTMNLWRRWTRRRQELACGDLQRGTAWRASTLSAT